MIKKIGILDYGTGNLHSAAKAFAHVGADVMVTDRLEELGRCDGLVVPGVGAFAECANKLAQVGGFDYIRGWVQKQRPLFGICVGHQILFQSGLELGVPTEGLGVYPGVVTGLAASPLPHMGWNTVESRSSSRLFDGLRGQRFYFVHSYAVQQAVRGAAYTSYDDVRFVAAVEQGPICSTQFHPEKSGDAGLHLLKNWLAAN